MPSTKKLYLNPYMTVQFVNGKAYILDPIKQRAIKKELLNPSFYFLIKTLSGDDPLTIATIAEKFKDSPLFHTFSIEDIEKSLEGLVDSGILVESRDSYDAYLKWTSKGWRVPFLYHHATNNLLKYNYSLHGEKADIETMKRYCANEKPPENLKDFQGSKSINLTKLKLGEIGEDSSDEVSIDTLNKLIHLNFSQIGEVNLHVTGKHVRKPIPSGGARHPTEIYVFLNEVVGIDDGVYFFNCKRNTLEFIASMRSEVFQECMIRNPDAINFQPKIAFLYTSKYERSMFRYRESRSYKVLHLDIGHILQNVTLCCNAMGLKIYNSYASDEKNLSTLLGLKELDEYPFAFSVVGSISERI